MRNLPAKIARWFHSITVCFFGASLFKMLPATLLSLASLAYTLTLHRHLRYSSGRLTRRKRYVEVNYGYPPQQWPSLNNVFAHRTRRWNTSFTSYTLLQLSTELNFRNTMELVYVLSTVLFIASIIHTKSPSLVYLTVFILSKLI